MHVQLKVSQNTVVTVIREYKASHSIINQSSSGHSSKLTPQTLPSLHTLVLKIRLGTWLSIHFVIKILGVLTKI